MRDSSTQVGGERGLLQVIGSVWWLAGRKRARADRRGVVVALGVRESWDTRDGRWVGVTLFDEYYSYGGDYRGREARRVLLDIFAEGLEVFCGDQNRD